MVELVVDDEMTVNEIAHTLKIGLSTDSTHLSCLTRAGVLMVTQRGTHRYYRARGPRIGRILKLIRKYCYIHGLECKPKGMGCAPLRRSLGLPRSPNWPTSLPNRLPRKNDGTNPYARTYHPLQSSSAPSRRSGGPTQRGESITDG